jgi:hypothetical protein
MPAHSDAGQGKPNHEAAVARDVLLDLVRLLLWNMLNSR